MKVKALIQCSLEIEYEDDNLASDINITQENIEMSRIDELIGLETEDSIQMI
jgi:hypothetical protein